MKHIKLFETFITENETINFPINDIQNATELIKTEIGHAPGYFFFAIDDDIKKFDELWKEEKYTEALNMLASTIDLDIEDLDSLKNWISNN